jgi:hypothetical protein
MSYLPQKGKVTIWDLALDGGAEGSSVSFPFCVIEALDSAFGDERGFGNKQQTSQLCSTNQEQ